MIRRARADTVSQLALPLGWAEGEDARKMVLGPCNRDAIDLLTGGDTWHSTGVILTGPPRCGKSKLGAHLADGGAVAFIDDADRMADEALFHHWNRARDEGKAGHGKHMIRFRREDQLHQAEAREVIMINSHDGSSAYKLSAGVFRLVCSNGLVVGREDVRQTVRHSGNVVDDVIEGATRIISDFELVSRDMETMKSVQLEKPLMLAFANAAIEARFNTEEKPVTAEQILRPRRHADMSADLWTVFNRVQENVIRGGITGFSKDANGRTQRRRTREVKGIDQNDTLNRALWRLATEVAKIAAK